MTYVAISTTTLNRVYLRPREARCFQDRVSIYLQCDPQNPILWAKLNGRCNPKECGNSDWVGSGWVVCRGELYCYTTRL